MIAILDKAKQFLVLSIKVIVVCGAFYFIYCQLANNHKLEWQKFIALLQKNGTFSGILFILMLSFLNRFFEILKWQNLVSSFRKITIYEATTQVLGAVTLGIFTPNGLGEYAGKALFYEKPVRKKIVFLNVICNGIQMVLTVSFGILGLLFFNSHFKFITLKMFSLVLCLSLLAIFIVFLLRSFTIKGYSLEKLWQKALKIPKEIHRKNTAFGVCRYLIFSHQYYFLFRAFEVQIPYIIMMAAIMSVYFVASSLPTFQFLDFAVKGGVAVWFFGMLGVNEWIVIFITTLMWFLNVVLPVVIGSYFVLNFKIKRAI